ncbi:LysE family transporter [Methyloligella sp. 2.7D]|uniref:LysE family transporter n=1 Tax=unclassified Methyloligella TaxID=2625955 RepID=UPI00157C4B02|nr:LysE family transporter [Methyloligella sp. GL2]QKP78272.1 LysE family transporter [Methyloligella sp. GL2]
MEAGAHIVLSGIQLVVSGLIIGLLVAAPTGPVNVLVIQRAVARGFGGGLAAGLGAVLGDGLLAAIAAFSMTAVSDIMIAYAGWIQIIGGIIILIFGVGLFLTRPVLEVPADERSSVASHMGIIPQTFLLTVTNPGAILGMLAIFGGLGSLVGGLETYWEAMIVVLSVMGGSLAWWLGLSELIATIRHRLTEGRLRLINRIAASILLVFGVVLLVKVFAGIGPV